MCVFINMPRANNKDINISENMRKNITLIEALENLKNILVKIMLLTLKF